jgi:hypothetical protein
MKPDTELGKRGDELLKAIDDLQLDANQATTRADQRVHTDVVRHHLGRIRSALSGFLAEVDRHLKRDARWYWFGFGGWAFAALNLAVLIWVRWFR